MVVSGSEQVMYMDSKKKKKRVKAGEKATNERRNGQIGDDDKGEGRMYEPLKN